MQLRFNSREQLVDALVARRAWAEGHDVLAARKHRAKEDEALKKFKAECSKLGRMSTARIKAAAERSDWRELQPKLALPECPMSAVAQLDEVLAALDVTHQVRFVLNGDYRDPIRYAHWLLTHDDSPRKRTVCA